MNKKGILMTVSSILFLFFTIFIILYYFSWHAKPIKGVIEEKLMESNVNVNLRNLLKLETDDITIAERISKLQITNDNKLKTELQAILYQNMEKIMDENECWIFSINSEKFIAKETGCIKNKKSAAKLEIQNLFKDEKISLELESW